MDTDPAPAGAVPLWALLSALFLLVLLSAFFSASETAMMSLNRYRLRHHADSGNRRAHVAMRLLQKPDLLLSTILLGNNLVNMAAASVATVIALRLFGEYAIAVATFVMTMLILVFAEVPPKTLAAMYPERIAYPLAPILYRMQVICRPLTLLINIAGNFLLQRLPGITARDSNSHLSTSELRSAVRESSSLIPKAHRTMLLRILDLDGATVDDVMVPRNNIEAINVEGERERIWNDIKKSQHAYLPLYRKNLDQVIGILNVRTALTQLDNGNKDNGKNWRKMLIKSVRASYFIPEGANLSEQFLQLQQQHHRMGLVVDEFGDIKGLITVEDLLEEIVGEFTSGTSNAPKGMHPCKDGAWLIDGSTTIRDINRQLEWQLPTDGPKTMNGLILEYLEQIPPRGFTLKINGRPIEIVRTQGTTVALARVDRPLDTNNDVVASDGTSSVESTRDR